MRCRTLLVDASYLLKSSFEGSKDTSTSKFGHIGGLYFFFTKLRKLIKDYKINKVILVWDGENGGIFRYQIDRAYKANRKNKSWYEPIVLTEYEKKREADKEKSVLKQRKRIQAYAEELFLRQIEVSQIEADDLIESYCIKHNETEDIYIYTTDRDFAQLLYLNITIIFKDINTPINRGNFSFHFNYHYRNVLTMKIICGDVSDNIKGIPGIQERTLLKHFPDLEFKYVTVREICKKAVQINNERIENKKAKLKALSNLVENIDRLKTNYQLINLSEPMLNNQAEEELEQLIMPLSPEDRGSKNLVKMMSDDEFLTIYNSNFVNYVEPFYSVIMSERDSYKKYHKKK